MTNRETTLYWGDHPIHIYMQSGFFDFRGLPVALHCHQFTEVQIIVEGCGRYRSGNRQFTLRKGELLIIPPEFYHESCSFDPGTLRITFQTDWPVNEMAQRGLPSGVPELLYREIRRVRETGKSGRLNHCLALICAEFPGAEEQPMEPIQDRAFLIREFFAQNYSGRVTLVQLAGVLGVSTKQAERLIRKYLDSTFRRELTRYRMEAARQLMAETDLSLSQIAEKVGYQSYSGFWKAYSELKNKE